MVREKEIVTHSTSSRLFIRLVLPSGEAMAAPPLSAILGQVQVNSNDFCKQFNAVSHSAYELGTLLNVHLFKNVDGTFFFSIRGIFTPFLIFQAADEERCVPLEVFYDIFQLTARANRTRLFFSAKESFGALRAMNFSLLLLGFALIVLSKQLAYQSRVLHLMPSTVLANYYARFFLGCSRFSHKRYVFFPDYTILTLTPTNDVAASVRLISSSPFILSYLSRRGFMQYLTGLETGTLSVRTLQQSYQKLVKPFRQVILPLSGGSESSSALFLAAYPVQPYAVYTGLFSRLLFWRFSVPSFLVYGSILRIRPLPLSTFIEIL